MTTTNGYVSSPGEILVEEFLKPMGISQYRLAKAIHKPQSAVSEIVRGTRMITPQMAVLLSRALGTTAEFWLSLECAYRLKVISSDPAPEVEKLYEEA